MVTYIFYCLITVYISSFKKIWKTVIERKKDMCKKCSLECKLLLRKQRICEHSNILIILNGVIFQQISYDIIPYARLFLSVRLFRKYYFNKVCFQLWSFHSRFVVWPIIRQEMITKTNYSILTWAFRSKTSRPVRIFITGLVTGKDSILCTTTNS